MQTETNLNPAGHSVTDYVPVDFSFSCWYLFRRVRIGIVRPVLYQYKPRPAVNDYQQPPKAGYLLTSKPCVSRCPDMTYLQPHLETFVRLAWRGIKKPRKSPHQEIAIC